MHPTPEASPRYTASPVSRRLRCVLLLGALGWGPAFANLPYRAAVLENAVDPRFAPTDQTLANLSVAERLDTALLPPSHSPTNAGEDLPVFWLPLIGALFIGVGLGMALVWRDRNSRRRKDQSGQQARNEAESFKRQKGELEKELLALKEREQVFSSLALTAQDAIVLLNPQAKVVFWNRAAERIFGYSTKEAMGCELHALVTPEPLREHARAAFRRFSTNGEGPVLNQTLEMAALRKNGQLFPVELSISALSLSAGWHAIGVVRDITDRRRYEDRLLREKARSDLYLNTAGSLMLALDMDGRITQANQAAATLLGMPVTELIGQDLCAEFVAESRQDCFREIFEHLGRSVPLNTEERSTEVVDAKGKKHAMVWEFALLREDGAPIGVLCSALDVSEHQQLQATRQSFANVVTKNHTGILVLDAQGRIQFSNPAAQRSLGRDRDTLQGESFGVPLQGENFEMEILRPGGSLGVVEVSATVTEWNEKRAFLVMLHDVTDRKRAEEQVRYLAYHDSLTGLPNRDLFMDRLHQAIRRESRSEGDIALLYMDLNRFKQVNDTLGHRVGDELLKASAQRFKNTIRGSDTVARLGGDEFIVLLENLDGEQRALEVAEKILRAFDQPVLIDEHALFTSPSIGIAHFPKDGEDADTLLRHADAAMYHAKRNVGRGVSSYCAELGAATGTLNQEAKLHRALDNAEFVLYYQPQIRIADNSLSGFEALIRWNDPERGLIPPGEFIPVLEDTGLIVAVGQWVLRQAIEQIVEWEGLGLETCPVSVNVSVRQLVRDDFADSIAELFREYRIPPHRLNLEVTESAVMTDLAFSKSLLLRLAQQGISLHLDDFGTGYSSLNVLKGLPFDTLKIDRGFIQDIPDDPDSATLTRTIIAMARNLRLTTIAEGVETTEQLKFLRDQRCDVAQGYLFNKPLAAADAQKLLRNRKQRVHQAI